MTAYPRGTKIVVLSAAAEDEPKLANVYRNGIDLNGPLRPEHEETVRRLAYQLCAVLSEYDERLESERASRPSKAKDPSEHRIGGWRLQDRRPA